MNLGSDDGLQLGDGVGVLQVNGFDFGHLVVGVFSAVHDAQRAHELFAGLAKVATFFAGVNLSFRCRG